MTFDYFYISRFNRVIHQLNWDSHQESVPYDFPLVVSHTISIIYLHLWCMLGGIGQMCMKSSLFRFINGQTHFNTSCDAKMSL